MRRVPSSPATRVILWEDDPVRRPLLAAILEAASLPVARPARAEIALDALAVLEDAVLVLDANVARPSGAEFLRELRHRRAGRIPATLALVQPGQAGLHAAMADLGVDRLLSEPFTPAELAAAVRALLPAPGRAT